MTTLQIGAWIVLALGVCVGLLRTTIGKEREGSREKARAYAYWREVAACRASALRRRDADLLAAHVQHLCDAAHAADMEAQLAEANTLTRFHRERAGDLQRRLARQVGRR